MRNEKINDLNQRRLIAAVRKAERVKPVPPQLGRTKYVDHPGFWAKIKGGDTSTSGVFANTYKYSWTAVQFNTSLAAVEIPEWGQALHTDSDGYAVEAKWKSQYVYTDEIVFMRPAKNTTGENYYLFDYNGGSRRVSYSGTPTIPANGSLVIGGVKVFNPSNVAMTLQAGKTLIIQYIGGIWFASDSSNKPDIQLRVSGLNFQISYDSGTTWTTWASGGTCP